MIVSYETAKEIAHKKFGVDPYFPKAGAQCSEKHVEYMLQVVWPLLASYRKVLVAQRAMSTYTALGMFAVGDTDIGHLGAGHIFYIDYPGKGKTILAKVPSLVVGGTSSRFQGAPDALTTDFTGNRIIDFDEDGKRVFRLVEGPGFSQIILYDEVNRTNPRAQAALLEVMGEGTITIAGETHKVKPFIIFTANPVEKEGVFPLNEALLDRIMFQILGQDFTAEDFTEILRRTDEFDSLELEQVCDIEKVAEIRRFFYKNIRISDEVLNCIGRVCEALNRPSDLAFMKKIEQEVGGQVVVSSISGRGAVHLKGAARVLAALRYRDYVTPDDVYKVLLPVLRHRFIFAPGVLPFLKAELGHRDTLATRDAIIKDIVQEIW